MLVGLKDHRRMRRVVGLTAGVLALVAAASAHAVPKAGGLDLQLNSADVTPAPAPPFRSITSGPTDETADASVGAIDQAPVTASPNRRKPGTGSLNSLAGDDTLLKELLEDKTIPLFRVRMESPF